MSAMANDRGAGSLLALGFGTTVAMWAVGYVTHLPGLDVPGAVVAALLVAVMFAGGYVAGRRGPHGIRGGLRAGLLAALLNMLVLGSLLASEGAPPPLVWVPGAFLFGAALGAAGAWLGARARAAARATVPAHEIDWTNAFAWVGAAATLLLLGVGGLVTSHGAGLAVVDWPNSFGYNMFLYPLSRMTGGVYYEHAHRLFGALVGLTTVVLALHLARVEARRTVRLLAALAVVLVIAQGILGGLRVTGRFTLSTSAAETAPSTPLAVVHGVTGQVFFVLMVALALMTTRTWREALRAPARGSASDRVWAPALVGVLFLQLVLGAILRHHGSGLLVHIGMATFVFLLAVSTGMRAWALPGRAPVVRRTGVLLMLLTAVQILLGLAAVGAVGMAPGTRSSGALRAWLATPHQVNGALLLAVASALTLWIYRTTLAGERTTETAGADTDPAPVPAYGSTETQTSPPSTLTG